MPKPLNEQVLTKLVDSKPFRKGESEASMAAKLAFSHKTAELAAAVKRQNLLKGLRA